ncbi:MAG: transposase [Candidatus Binataceae bacterium]
MLRFYRRQLPHYRKDDAWYFVTWPVAPGGAALADGERSIVAEKIWHDEGLKYELAAFVVMDDHVHTIVLPLGGRRLESILRDWKSFTAHEIQRKRGARGALWQSEYFDRLIRDERELEQKRLYIRMNPFKRWPELDTYLWVSPLQD